jgi:hypothetical protein
MGEADKVTEAATTLSSVETAVRAARSSGPAQPLVQSAYRQDCDRTWRRSLLPVRRTAMAGFSTLGLAGRVRPPLSPGLADSSRMGSVALISWRHRPSRTPRSPAPRVRGISVREFRERPCLSACPVSAFAADRPYDYASCRSYLKEGTADCLTQACAARRACPVAPQMRYAGLPSRFPHPHVSRKSARLTAGGRRVLRHHRIGQES